MPQMLLPIFPPEATEINNLLGFARKGETIYYFNGQMPIFSHHQDDLKSFRLITSQLVVNGNATQMEIVRAFGISKISVKRYVKLYRNEGAEGFFKPRKGRSASVLTPEVISRIQSFLDEGKDLSFISAKENLKRDTLNKAIRDGRLRKLEKKS